MKNFRSAILLVAFLTACSSSSTSPTGTTTTPTRLYVVSFASDILKYVPPFSNGSSPTVTLAGFNGASTSIGKKLYVINDSNPATISGFTTPLTGTSTPFVTISFAANNAYNITADAGGNLWYSDRGLGTVGEFTPPFSNSSTAAMVLGGANGVSNPAQIAFDKAGDMAVAEESTNDVLFFTAPITIASVPTATIPLGTEGQAVAFDSAGNLYASNYSATGIFVFNPPFSNTSAPAFTIPTNESVQCLAFRGGNLWGWDFVPEVTEFTPPFSSASTPVITITNGLPSSESCLSFGA